MRFLISGCLLLLCITGTAQRNTFIIKGKIGALDAPAKLFLRYSMNKTPHIDSVTLKRGAFQFTGKADEPVPASLLLSRNGKPVQWPYDELMFYIDTGTLLINSRDSIRHAIVAGSQVNEEFRQYNTLMERLTVSGLPYDSLKYEAAVVNRRFVVQNPASLVSLTAIRLMSNDADTLPAFDSLLVLFKGLDKELQAGKRGQELYASLQKKQMLLPGMPAPDFMQPDSSGKQISLSSLRGRFILLDIWASWCKPCRADNKELVKLYEKYKDKNFTLLGVSVDTKRDAWLKAVQDDQLRWLQLCDLQRENAVAALYQITGVPTTYLLDPSGAIIARNIHGKALEELLEKVLN
jgi:peroxiredoxin